MRSFGVCGYVCLLVCLSDDSVVRKDLSVDWGTLRILAKSRLCNRQSSETLKMGSRRALL